MLYSIKDKKSSLESIVVEANCPEQAEDFGYYYFASKDIFCNEVVGNYNGKIYLA